MPSNFECFSWEVTLGDILFKLRTQLSIEQLRGVMMFQAVAEVISLAFGGKKGDEEFIPKTAEEATAMFNRVMNSGRTGQH